MIGLGLSLRRMFRAIGAAVGIVIQDQNSATVQDQDGNPVEPQG